MQCPACNAFVESDTIFCGNCGKQIKPVKAQGVTIDYAVISQNDQTFDERPGATIPENALQPPPVQKNSATPLTPQPVPSQPGHRSNRRMAIAAAIALLVLAGGIVMTLALVHSSANPSSATSAQTAQKAGTQAGGQIVFFDGTGGDGHTNGLRITASGLQAPPSGEVYDAWLLNTSTEQVTPLGTLKATGSSFSLGFTSATQTNLLGLGDQIVVTAEKGTVKLPGGAPILSATFPPKAFVHIKHLLFSFPTTPDKTGLLVGLFEQTKLLSAQAQVLQGIASNQNQQVQECIAQSIIDIIEGQQGSNYSPLSQTCGSTTATGDGFGILGTGGYASTAAQHAALAATQSDATSIIQQHAKEVETATTNIIAWVTTIQQDALKLLNGQGTPDTINEIATLAQQAHLGVDANGNGTIEAFPGEAGAASAHLYGQLMASLTLSRT